jgi:hypothetical protein|tara:strand:+ start:527 stop:979 length:453 start_codon:yes stop_codon:yes gene_type:complete
MAIVPNTIRTKERIMRTIILTMALAIATVFSTQAQERGDWYVGTGDVANVAWTDWAVSPTVGYGVMDNLMVGISVAQADSTVDMAYDLHARYFTKGYFVYVATNGLSTDAMSVGLGKMFTLRKGVYVDPKIVYNTEMKTTNLTLGFGLKF